MIVVRCANGVVLFRVRKIHGTDFIEWECLNDKSTDQQPRTAGGYEQFLRDMATKSAQLRGAVQQVIDLPSII